MIVRYYRMFNNINNKHNMIFCDDIENYEYLTKLYVFRIITC